MKTILKSLICSAWNDINILTIQKCFKKSGGFTEPISVEENPDDQDGWNFLIERSDTEI